MSYFTKTGLFTVISFASFLIPPDNVPGRMLLLITTLLAQANVASNALLKVPDSDKMSNVWKMNQGSRDVLFWLIFVLTGITDADIHINLYSVCHRCPLRVLRHNRHAPIPNWPQWRESRRCPHWRESSGIQWNQKTTNHRTTDQEESALQSRILRHVLHGYIHYIFCALQCHLFCHCQ